MTIRAAIACALLLLAAPTAAQRGLPTSAEALAELRKQRAHVLFWTQQQRDANFRRMKDLFPAVVVKAGGRVRQLPVGQPLALSAAEVDSFVAAQHVAGLILLKDGKVRLERYARGFDRNQRWTSFSVAKSLTSTLIGTAVKQGKLRLGDPVTRFIPEMQGSGYDGVTVEQVLTMSSGVRWSEDYTDPNSDVAQMSARDVPAGEDVVVAYMKTLPRAAPPGTKFNYNTGETNLAGVILARAVGKPLALYASQRLWRPAGMEADAYWNVDERGQAIAGCCLSARLRDFARLGQLMLEDGRGLLPRGWVGAATRIHQPFPQPGRGYGYFWWIEPGAYRASGIFGQQIWVDPKRRVVVAAVGAWPKATDAALSAQRAAFFERLASASM